MALRFEQARATGAGQRQHAVELFAGKRNLLRGSLHFDDAAAAASHFGRLAASGWHTASAWMRCYVEADEKARQQRIVRNEILPEHGPSPGITNLKWIKPVYPGDTVTYWMEITAKREMASRPRWGLATKHSEGFNQDGELVFAFDGKVMIQRRGA